MAGPTDSKSTGQLTQIIVNFTNIQIICDQLLSTSVEWRNGEKLASTSVRISNRPKSTQVIVIPDYPRTSTKPVWPNETQVENLRGLKNV